MSTLGRMGSFMGMGMARPRLGPPEPRITLSAPAVTEGVAANTDIGPLAVADHPSGASGWAFSVDAVLDSAKFNTLAAMLRTSGTWAYTPSVTGYQVRVRATKAPEADLTRVFTIPVLAVLGNLTADIPATLALGVPASGTTTGAHDTNETISISGPAGLTVDSAARTWAWSGSGSPASTIYQLTGTHPQATNSPRATAAEALDVIELSVPDAFAIGDWTLADAASGGTLSVTISSLPANGGASITDVEYRVDGGTWTSSGGTTDFSITGLTDGVEHDVELRAVNSIGGGAASDVKAATPTAIPNGTLVDDNGDYLTDANGDYLIAA